MRTVELICDDALDGAVRAVWRRLAAAGLPSLANHPHPTNRPHLTLATADELPAGPVTAAMESLPVGVHLGGLIFFEGRAGMVAWRVHAGEALHRLHAEVWRALDGRERNPLHAPQVWVPHVSLARRVKPDQREAVRALVEPVVADGRFVAARSYDSETRTVVDLG